MSKNDVDKKEPRWFLTDESSRAAFARLVLGLQVVLIALGISIFSRYYRQHPQGLYEHYPFFIWLLIVFAYASVAAVWLLPGISQKSFRRLVSVLLALVGLFIFVMFESYSKQPDLLRQPASWFICLLLLVAYGLGAVTFRLSAARFAFVIDWKFVVFLFIFALYPWWADIGSRMKVLVGQFATPDNLIKLVTVLGPVAVVAILVKMFKADIQGWLRKATTVEGFGLRLQLIDQRRPPTMPLMSFRELMVALSQLIREAELNDTIRFTAYTPALGFLAQTKQEWDELHRLLNLNLSRISMTCLAEWDLEIWHERFEGKVTKRGRIGKGLIQQATYVSEELLRFIDAERKPLDEFPEYYLFASKNRAIVVVPFNVPKLEGERTREAPSMVGFVSDEPKIVELVHDTHDKFYRPRPDSVKSVKDLIRAVYYLISRAGHRDTIRITAHTLALGYFSEIRNNEEARKEWNELRKLLEDVDNQRRMSIVCRGKGELQKWMADSGAVQAECIQKAINFSEELLGSIIEAVSKDANKGRANKGDERGVVRTQLSNFPSHCVFASEKAAIFVTSEISSLCGFVTMEPRLVGMIHAAHDMLHKNKKHADLFTETINEWISLELPRHSS